MAEPEPTREYRKCPSCGQYRHYLMFPWADLDAYARAYPPRSDSPRAQRAYERRAAEAAARREAAQAKGRNYSRCLPCLNGDAP